jgi:hypothetical protein
MVTVPKGEALRILLKMTDILAANGKLRKSLWQNALCG